MNESAGSPPGEKKVFGAFKFEKKGGKSMKYSAPHDEKVDESQNETFHNTEMSDGGSK